MSPANATESRVKKTRNRLPISCESCRKKKMKCDKQKPCSGCIKNKTEDSCKYAQHSSETASKSPISNEIIKLRLRINKLEKILSSNNININDYDDVSFAINSYEQDSKDDKDDPLVLLTERFDKMIFKENKIFHSGTTSITTFFSGDEQLSLLFQKYFNRHEEQYHDYQQAQKISIYDKVRSDANMSKKYAFDQYDACELPGLPGIAGSSSLVASKTVGGEANSELLKQVNDMLPPMYAIEALITHFFTYVYYKLPYVDESLFREELSYVLVSDSNGKASIHITHVLNTSIVSLLLIILRFGYLAIDTASFFEDTSLIPSEDLARLIRANIVIDASYIDIAKNLLLLLPSSESIFKMITLRNVQVLLLLRLYQSYAPELNQESYESSLSLSMIIQMCRVLGAYRDPDHFPKVFKDWGVKNIWRRIYYKLIHLDALNSFDFGCPLIIQAGEYDIKLPSLNNKDSATLNNFRKGLSVNATDKQLKSIITENAINRDIVLQYASSQLIIEGVQLCASKSGAGFKKSEFMDLVKRIENFLDTKVTGIYEIIEGNDLPSNFRIDDPIERIFKIPKLMKLEIRLNLLSILTTLNYLLYLSEDQSNKEERKGYAIKATESSLILFKFNYDFAKFLNESEVVHGNDKLHKSFAKFSNRLEKLITSEIVSSFLRSMLWLFSMFLKNYQNDNFVSFDSILRSFGNSTDSIKVLTWLNADFDNEDNVQFLKLIIRYIKEYYVNCVKLKKDYFSMWRSTMLIKVFINYFKNTQSEKFNEIFMGVENPSRYSSRGNETSEANKNQEFKNDNTDDDENFEMPNAEALNPLDLSELLFDDEDAMIASIQTETLEYSKEATQFSLFMHQLGNEMQTDSMNYQPIDIPSELYNKNSSNISQSYTDSNVGGKHPESVSDTYSHQTSPSTNLRGITPQHSTGFGSTSDVFSRQSFNQRTPSTNSNSVNEFPSTDLSKSEQFNGLLTSENMGTSISPYPSQYVEETLYSDMTSNIGRSVNLDAFLEELTKNPDFQI